MLMPWLSLRVAYVSTEPARLMGYRLRVFPRLAHDYQIIGGALAAHCGVFHDLFVGQPERVCARSCHERIFPDCHFGVVDETMLLKRSNQVTAKILDADVSIMCIG